LEQATFSASDDLFPYFNQYPAARLEERQRRCPPTPDAVGQHHGVSKGEKRSSSFWSPPRFHAATSEIQIILKKRLIHPFDLLSAVSFHYCPVDVMLIG
jgi:hypothetical protein